MSNDNTDKTYYIFVQSLGQEYVARYTAEEMSSVFGAEVFKALASGEVIDYGAAKYVDMEVAARLRIG